MVAMAAIDRSIPVSLDSATGAEKVVRTIDESDA